MGGDRSIEVSWMSTRQHGSMDYVRLDRTLEFH
jgi:hypothetical protein